MAKLKAPKELAHALALENEQALAAMLPYSHHYDEFTIKTHNDQLLRVFEVRGVSFETASDDEINKWHRQLHQMLMQNAENDVSFWTHIVKEEAAPPDYSSLNSGFSNELDKIYKDKLVDEKFFQFSLFITVVIKVNYLRIPILTSGIGKMDAYFEAANETLDNITRHLERIDHEPRCLGIYEKNGRMFSQPLMVLSRLISGSWQPIPLSNSPANELISNSRVITGKETLEIRTDTDTFYAAGFGLRDYPHPTSPLMLSEMLTLPFPFILAQSFVPIPKESARSQVKKAKRILVMSGDDATDQINQIDELLNDIAARRVTMGDHNLALFVFTDKNISSLPGEDESKKIRAQLKARIATAKRVVGDMNCLPVREDLALNAQYFSMMPGNLKYRPRVSLISSANFCGLFPMHSIPTGTWHEPHWGDTVTTLKTRFSTLFNFNFHAGSGDLGHTLLFGSSGIGKTTLQTFLLSQAEKFGAKTVFFDRRRGSEIFIRAVGGRYRTLNRGVPSGLNPYQLEPNKTNLDFLSNFTLLLAYPNLDAPPKIENEVAEVIQQTLGDTNRPNHLRNFNELYNHFQSHELRERLHKWRRGNQNGWLFDNDEDTLQFDRQFIGIDTTDFLDDKILSPACFFYLTHRLKELYGSRFFSVFDEFWRMLDDPVFNPWIKDELKLMRRMRGIFIGATQDTNDVVDSDLVSTLLGQCPTRIFLPNYEANQAVYERFNISEIEFNWIKEADAKYREFLLKQGKESVILSLDLHGLNDQLSILSGRESNLPILEQCMAETSENPDDWLPLFYERYNRE